MDDEPVAVQWGHWKQVEQSGGEGDGGQYGEPCFELGVLDGLCGVVGGDNWP